MDIEIKPKEEKENDKYVDQFWIGLYASLCANAHSEQRLIMMRNTAFLVANSIFLSLTKDAIKSPSDNSLFLIYSGLIGLCINVIWSIQQYAGQMNQNRFFWQASQLRFKHVKLELLTDCFRDKDGNLITPYGSIFLLSRLMPITFSIAYCAMTYEFVLQKTKSQLISLLICVAFFVLSASIALISCNTIKKKNITC